jgi:hypothetical protein
MPPMPSISSFKLNDEPLRNSFLNHRKSKSNLAIKNEVIQVVHSVPHEIGPNDIITTVAVMDEKPAMAPVPLPQDKVQTAPLLPDHQVPDLLRNDTLSSDSSNNEEAGYPTEGNLLNSQHVAVNQSAH